MARTPFYGRNDTKIAKMDMQAATAPGRAYRDAFENLGKVGADVLNKFREAKKEKQEEEDFVNMGKQMPWESFKAFGVENEDERDAFLNRIKKKDTREQAINLVEFSIKQKQAQEASRISDLQMQQIMRNMERQESADQLAGEERMADNQFMQSLMSQTTSPQAQRQADIARPGLPALGNADARNRFMQAQLQQPQNQVSVSNLGSQDFGRFAREQGLDPTRSVQRMEALRQAELANQPKALSPSDQLAREKYEDKKAEDVQETETAKIESTNNLTDFYNETKSLLDKINEKGVDVTGPIEGTSIYRFFSKLGDTDDEQVRRRLEMFTRKLTLDAAQNLKGALSDKDIRFLVEQAPDMDDNPSVWKKYMGDLVLRLERNANQQGIELGVSQADLSTLASQSILDEIERKKQLRSKRAGL